MKVLVSKYQINAIGERYPLCDDCPDYVEVECIFPPVRDLPPEQRKRLVAGLKAALIKPKRKSRKS
jgi:hypothetical protein